MSYLAKSWTAEPAMEFGMPANLESKVMSHSTRIFPFLAKLLVFAATLLPAFGFQATSGQQKLSSNQIEKIRFLVKRTMAERQVPGATFAIGLDAKIAWSEGFGYADVENKTPASPDTAYRTAS